MSRLITVDDDLWRKLFYPLREKMLEGYTGDRSNVARYLEEQFASIGFTLHRDGPNGFWYHIEIADEVDMIELVLKWG